MEIIIKMEISVPDDSRYAFECDNCCAEVGTICVVKSVIVNHKKMRYLCHRCVWELASINNQL